MMEAEWLDAPNSNGYWWHYGNLWAANTPTAFLTLRHVQYISEGWNDQEELAVAQRRGYAVAIPAVLLNNPYADGKSCQGKYSAYWGKWKWAGIESPTDLPDVKRG